MRSATAIGLAISADAGSAYVLRDRFARHFGVWREAGHGLDAAFDVLFPRGMALPRHGEPPLRAVRTYRPIHNIGHFRYAEAVHLCENGQPSGDVTVWGDIRFPFDPSLRDLSDLSMVSVRQYDENAGADEVEEEYACDASGLVTVTIRERRTLYHRDYALARWPASSSSPDRIAAMDGGMPPGPRSAAQSTRR
jgi:molecular chaperone DnaK